MPFVKNRENRKFRRGNYCILYCTETFASAGFVPHPAAAVLTLTVITAPAA
jgi:hypothetical protein